MMCSRTRREMLKVAMAAVAVAATADAAAGAQTAGGKIKAIGFDAFTIFDFRSIDAAFEENFPGKAKEIAATWRTRLFEYTWLRTLNRNYANLEQVSQDALTFACKSAKTELSPEVPGKIIDAFLQLKPFPELGRRSQSYARSGNQARLCFRPHAPDVEGDHRKRWSRGPFRAPTEHGCSKCIQAESARLPDG